MPTTGQPQDIPYSSFVEDVKNNRVDSVVLQGEMIYGVHKDKSTFKTRNPETDYTALIGTLLKAGVQIESREPKPPNFFGQLLLQMAPALLLILVFLYMLRQMQGASGGRGAMSFGKSRARLLGEDQVNVTFADVAGVEEAKQEVAEIVDFLKDPGKVQKLGGKIPTCSIRRCCARGASTGRWWCRCPTCAAVSRFCACTCAACRSPTT